MAKKSGKKKVVSVKKAPVGTNKTTITPTVSRAKSQKQKKAEPMLFGKQNFMLLGAGLVLMALGFILMLGGDMPDPTVWDEDIIYGFRRIVLAPFMILAGLVTLIFSVFKKQSINTLISFFQIQYFS